MTAREDQDELEAQFAQWRPYVQRRRELLPSDVIRTGRRSAS
jgi:hypothetical protein